MSDDLDPITGDLTRQLASWLDRPSPLSQQIEALREQVKALKASGLKTTAFDDTLKQLEKAETEARRVRQKQAAQAIASACKELGVVLEAKDPPKRQRRRTSSQPGDATAS